MDCFFDAQRVLLLEGVANELNSEPMLTKVRIEGPSVACVESIRQRLLDAAVPPERLETDGRASQTVHFRVTSWDGAFCK
ncbi:MAG: hypothetical protein NVS3B20_18260 [Polyangiales bacterium]